MAKQENIFESVKSGFSKYFINIMCYTNTTLHIHNILKIIGGTGINGYKLGLNSFSKNALKIQSKCKYHSITCIQKYIDKSVTETSHRKHSQNIFSNRP